MLSVVFFITALVLAITATVLGMIFIVPEKRRKSLGKFGKLLHDFFNFKFLVIEKIIQVTYILSSVFVFIYGFLSIFSFRTVEYSYLRGYESRTEWTGYNGFIIMILGSIALRILYELATMAIIAIKNIIQINNKLKNQNEDDSEKTHNPYQQAQ